MRFKEFKPVLIEFANVATNASLDQVKVELDSISQVAKVLPPEADLEIKKIAFDFAQTKRKVEQFLTQLQQSGNLVLDQDEESEEPEDADGGQPVEPVVPQEVEPAAQPVDAAQEPADIEQPAVEPEGELEPEEPIKEAVDDDVSGDFEYNEAVKAIEEAMAEIEYYQSLDLPESVKKRIIAQYQKTIDTTEKLVKKYKDTVVELRTEREKRKAAEQFSDEVFDILELLANKVQGYLPITKEEYDALNKSQKKLHDNARTFASTFKTAFFGMVLNMLRKNQNIDRSAISSFLKACYNGDVIDMLALVAKGQGNVRDHVTKDYTDMVNLFAQYGVFSWSPGKSGGAIGPGEMALSMMGNPAEKAKSGGDLIVGGTKLEIKAGATSGGRLNSKKILKGPAVWDDWAAGIEDIIKKNKSIPKDMRWDVTDKKGNVAQVSRTNFTANQFRITNGKPKFGCKYNFNYRNLASLNDEVLVYSTPEQTFDLFYNTFSKLITNLDDIAKPGTDEKGNVIVGPDNKPLFPGLKAEKLIWDACFDDGTIDVNKIMAAYTRLAYESYNRADHVESIMFLNTETLDYTIAKGSQDLLQKMGGGANSTVRISGGFNFNDDQQSATPAYLATARSEKIQRRK